MALTLKDRVLETCTSPGTGAVTLLGAVTGYQAFSTVGNGNTCYYTIADQSGANWECGIGTYATSGNTLTRTTILSSSNAGSTVNFATGTQNVFLTYPSEKAVYLDASGNVQPSLGTATFSSITDSGLTSGRVTYATTGGLLTDSANLTWNGSALGITGAVSASGQISGGNGAFSTATSSISLTNASYGNILSTNTLYIDTTSGAINIRPAGSTIGTFTTTGLGIGTSSPSYPLDVVSSGTFVSRFQNGSNQPVFVASVSGLSGIVSESGSQNGWLMTSASNYVTAYTNGTERMRIDSSGNLGLGVTPSAWGNTFNAIQIGARGSVWSSTSSGSTFLSQNTYYNAGFKYIATAASSNYEQGGGGHYWYTAPSGTAGNAITFTQAMTLDNSGNLGIGVTSPSSFGTLVVRPSSGTGTVAIQNSTPSNSLLISNSGAVASITYNDAFPLTFGTNSTERMRIDSSGNVGIGTTSPSFPLQVQRSGDSRVAIVSTSGSNTAVTQYSTNNGSTYWYNYYNGSSFIFQDNVLERMRIDSSGNLLVGTTTSPSGSNKIVGKAVTQGNQTSDTNQLYRSSSNGVFALSPTTQLSQWQSSSASNTFTITLSGRPSGLIVVGVQNNASGSQSAGGVFLAVATDTVLQVTTISQTGWVTITPSVSGFAITFTLSSSATGYWNATLLGTAVA